ncbi:MAG: cysteine desulfurase family protein [Pseudoramibacter sp.]
MNQICYLDNAATTKSAPQVVERMMKSFETAYFNPSAMYEPGLKEEKCIQSCKQRLGQNIHARGELDQQIIYTSGGSEGDNMLIRGVLDHLRRDVLEQGTIVTTVIEHPAVREIFQDYENQGVHVIWLPVDQEGFVNPKDLEKAVTEKTLLVSIMGVNNELGTAQPLEAFGRIIKSRQPNCFYHSDFVQGFMKYPVDVEKAQLDGLTLCGHKINGPKGIGAVYLRKGWPIKPLIFGGGQEHGLRSGTENVQGIVGFDEAVRVWESDEVRQLMYRCRHYVEKTLTEALDRVKILGPQDEKSYSPAVMSVAIEGIRGEVLLHACEAKQVYISTGSACSTHKKEKHQVQRAIGLSPSYTEGTIRISFSATTTFDEVKRGVQVIIEEAKKLRKFEKFIK